MDPNQPNSFGGETGGNTGSDVNGDIILVPDAQNQKPKGDKILTTKMKIMLGIAGVMVIALGVLAVVLAQRQNKSGGGENNNTSQQKEDVETEDNNYNLEQLLNRYKNYILSGTNSAESGEEKYNINRKYYLADTFYNSYSPQLEGQNQSDEDVKKNKETIKETIALFNSFKNRFISDYNIDESEGVVKNKDEQDNDSNGQRNESIEDAFLSISSHMSILNIFYNLDSEKLNVYKIATGYSEQGDKFLESIKKHDQENNASDILFDQYLSNYDRFIDASINYIKNVNNVECLDNAKSIICSVRDQVSKEEYEVAKNDLKSLLDSYVDYIFYDCFDIEEQIRSIR